jgi:hypothetical protein
MRSRSTAWRSVLSALAGAALSLGAVGALSLGAVGTQGCSDPAPVVEGERDASLPPEAGADDAPPLPEPTTVTRFPDAEPLAGESECKVVEVSDITVASGRHLSTCTAIEAPTNPPSGGEHWPVWALYAKYTSPVPREMYTHNLEHGGAVITYRCKDPCPELVAALEGVFDEVVDPYCITMSPPASRLVLTPDANIPTPIAVSTWRATYIATCLDPPSLKDFIQRFIGHGSEMVCGGGMDPAKILASCASGS